jgi:hypothetical protein
MLTIDGGRTAFFAEREEAGPAAHPSEPRRGLRGWLMGKAKALQEALARSDSWVIRQLRRIWDWLHERIPADESMLRGLRSAKTLGLYYPARLTPDQARAAWQGYLATRLRYHLKWLAFNVLMSPMLVLLAPLPGPNVLGYWFVYRAVCHALAARGIARARSGRIETVMIPSAALDTPLSEGDDEAIAQVSASLHLAGLADFLRRLPDAKQAPTRDTACAGR